ncbi:uncharacterized protein BP5553_10490 [Venustampulla echinocandica]|uniref:Uncharacterized protein n=1 Tax=Venustampulla echinocandica TaxID=2656787 RepID=A0A370T9H0_9HELO|nr:uncharacterized protein BP5553_10490 [Venustampulla echinocandica]RDL30212.1 hypothetical protein BP5553_10490 [Venustampulla echinocandica]
MTNHQKLQRLRQEGYLSITAEAESDCPQILVSLHQSVASNLLRRGSLADCVHQHFIYNRDWTVYRKFAFEKIDSKTIDGDRNWNEIATVFSEGNIYEYSAREVYRIWREEVDKYSIIQEQPSRLEPPRLPVRKRRSTGAIREAKGENKRNYTYARENEEAAKKMEENGERGEDRDAKLTLGSSSQASDDHLAAIGLSMLRK